MPRSVPTGEIDVWSARLDPGAWPGPEELPATERDRAARIRDRRRARRWAASRWALRDVLCRYLDVAPAEVALATTLGGKPVLTGARPPLRFNLSHSRELALVAVSGELEVGIDVEWVASRRPADFYAAWTRREAVAKCLGGGLASPPGSTEIAVGNVETEAGFAAALAVAAAALPPLRRLSLTSGMASPRLSAVPAEQGL